MDLESPVFWICELARAAWVARANSERLALMADGTGISLPGLLRLAADYAAFPRHYHEVVEVYGVVGPGGAANGLDWLVSVAGEDNIGQ